MKIKPWLPYLFVIVAVSLIVISPTFRLHFTGDDYQSFWRYELYMTGYYPGNWNMFTYFFTDEGSRDIAMQIINSLVGFKPVYYYITSYFLRLAAAFSLIPLVFYFTKNKFASFLSSLFFSITITGLEATDWVFNMPAYIAIISLNFFLLSLFKYKSKLNLNSLIILSFLFVLTVSMMSVRMAFLPVLAISIEIFWILSQRNKVQVKTSITRIVLYFLLVYLIFSFGNFGNTIGVSPVRAVRERGVWLSNLESAFSLAKKPFTENRLLLLYPVGQIGSIVMPNNIIPSVFHTLTQKRLLILLILPLLTLNYAILKLLKRSYPNITKKIFYYSLAASFAWTTIVWLLFSSQYLLTSTYLVMFFGGYVIIYLALISLAVFKKKEILSYILTPTILIVLSFAQYWMRFPQTILDTPTRYLIVPAAGLAILVGVIYNFSRHKGSVLILLVGLFAVHLYATTVYLDERLKFREYAKTENIRRSIPNVFTSENLKQPMIFYFEPKNSRYLYHTLLFGFPAFMLIQYDFTNPENIVYTEDWNEVVTAYLSKEAPPRFATSSKFPVKLENIYSFKLEGDVLLNTTEEVRNKLKGL